MRVRRSLAGPALLAVAISTLAVTSAWTGAHAQAPTAAHRSGLDLTGMDRAVRPQDDLYRFMNGGWDARTAIPPDKSIIGGVFDLRDKVDEQVRALAEEGAKPDAPAALRKMGAFYATYLDEAAVDKAGLGPLANELAAIDAVRSGADLARAFVRLSLLGVRTPVSPNAFPDADKPDTIGFVLWQGGLGLPGRDYYFEKGQVYDDTRADYVTYVTTLLALAGGPDASRAGADVLALETQLATIQWTPVQERDAVATHNPTNTATLPARYRGFEWGQWLRGLGVESQLVDIGQPSYVEGLARLTTSVPLANWRTYLKAALLDHYAPFLGMGFVDADFAYRGRRLSGRTELQPRWKRAVTALNVALGEAVGKAYVERHFPPQARERMASLIENLRAAMGHAIDECTWMSAPTKKEARAKLASFRAHIGSPAKWRDYSGLEVRQGDLVGNMMRAFEFETRYQLAKVDKPTDAEEWFTLPQVVNAFYSAQHNSITFPAAILQPPAFDVLADDAANYGAIGAVIGHEMGHGFDDQGRRSDATGKLRDWWTEGDAKEYERRVAGLVEQYSKYEGLPGLKVNGQLTLGENIGDLNGIEIALRAYHRSLDGRPAPVIDGFTGEQRFFLGFAQVWRAKFRDAPARQALLTDPHSPVVFRANGTVRNVDAFATAFEVKDGDGMWTAPEKRVHIW